MINVLMIEDDPEFAQILSEYLANYNIKITNYEDPYLGLSAGIKKYDLVILDLTLPGIDGIEVCREIRQKYDIPIIISSARGDVSDKVIGLQIGADDYLPKPYNPKELEARIKSHLRRAKENVKKKEELIGDLVLDEQAYNIYFKTKILNLTAAEFGILSYLVKKEGRVISREELLYNCEAISEESTNKSIDVIIGRIRQKLGDSSKNPRYIQAVRGIGYKYTK